MGARVSQGAKHGVKASSTHEMVSEMAAAVCPPTVIVGVRATPNELHTERQGKSVSGRGEPRAQLAVPTDLNSVWQTRRVLVVAAVGEHVNRAGALSGPGQGKREAVLTTSGPG